MKIIIKKILPDSLQKFLREIYLNVLDGYSLKCYSQEGEDMILNSIFIADKITNGFYVDIGAYHPKQYSNTYFFYKQGWSGINIDAMPGSMTLFKKVRPRDINLEVAIAKTPREMTFFIFNAPALNTFDENLALSRVDDTYYIVGKEKIRTRTLDEILRENLPSDQKIIFLSIDVEGLDLEVLQSNDWQMFRPSYVLVECLNFQVDEVKTHETYQYLKEKNYELLAKTPRTLIFRDIALNQ